MGTPGVPVFGQPLAMRMLPVDPVNPHSDEVCRDLRDRYDTIVRQIGEEARRVMDGAGDVLIGFSFSARYRSASREASALRAEASRISALGVQAYSRCLAQLSAFRQAGRQTHDSFGRTLGALGGVPGDTAERAMRRYGAEALRGWLERQPQPEAARQGRVQGIARGAGTLLTMLTYAERVDQTARMVFGGHDAVRGAALWSGLALGAGGNWTTFTSLRIRSSLDAIIAVHEAALADLDAALDRPAPSAGAMRALDAQRSFVSAAFADPAAGVRRDDLGETLADTFELMERERAARAEASDRAFREVAAAAAQARQARGTGGSGRGGGSARYSAAQCQQLQQQITHYQQQLSTIMSAGDVYGSAGRQLAAALRTGIDANRAEFRRGCQ